MRSASAFSLLALLAAVLMPGGCRLLVDSQRFSQEDAAFDTDGSVLTDATRSADAVGTNDGPSPGACAVTVGASDWSFGTVEVVASINSNQNDAEYFESPDRLTAYFASERSGGWKLWIASRSAADAPFDLVRSFDEINQPQGFETHFSVTADHLTAFVSSFAAGAGSADLWSATRPSETTPWAWAQFSKIDALNTTASEYDPLPSADGRRLYFARSTTARETELMVAERSSPGAPFATDTPLTEFNSASGDDHPALSRDERTIVFGSSRPGSQDHDLWYATRPSREAKFGQPRRLAALSSPASDAEPFLSADSCEIYFSSHRTGGQGGADIYRARILARP